MKIASHHRDYGITNMSLRLPSYKILNTILLIVTSYEITVTNTNHEITVECSVQTVVSKSLFEVSCVLMFALLVFFQAFLLLIPKHTVPKLPTVSDAALCRPYPTVPIQVHSYSII